MSARLNLAGLSALLVLGLIVGLSRHPATLLLTTAARAISADRTCGAATVGRVSERVEQRGVVATPTHVRLAGGPVSGLSAGVAAVAAPMTRVHVSRLDLPPPYKA